MRFEAMIKTKVRMLRMLRNLLLLATQHQKSKTEEIGREPNGQVGYLSRQFLIVQDKRDFPSGFNVAISSFFVI
jgi:hypothetical protein